MKVHHAQTGMVSTNFGMAFRKSGLEALNPRVLQGLKIAIANNELSAIGILVRLTATSKKGTPDTIRVRVSELWQDGFESRIKYAKKIYSKEFNQGKGVIESFFASVKAFAKKGRKPLQTTIHYDIAGHDARRRSDTRIARMLNIQIASAIKHFKDQRLTNQQIGISQAQRLHAVRPSR